MKLSPIVLAIFTVAYGLDVTSTIDAAKAVSSAQSTAAVNSGELQFNATMPFDTNTGPFAYIEQTVKDAITTANTLTQSLKHAKESNSINADYLSTFIAGIDASIDTVVNGVTYSLSDYSEGVSQVLGRYLVEPYTNAIAESANLVADSIGDGKQLDTNVLAGLLVHYERLGDFANFNDVNTSGLNDAVNRIHESTGTKASSLMKRNPMDAVRGSIQSFHDKMDSMFNIINNHQGHANSAVLTALITGLDGQIDNLAGNIFPIIDKATFGITTPISDFLLGPIFQSATDGVQVLVSNILGGSVDFVEDTVANVFTGSVNKLENIGNKMKVSPKNIVLLEDTKKQWTNLQKTMNDKKKEKVQEPEPTELAKRDGEFAVVKGAIQSFHDKMDSMFNIINNHQGHANAAVLTATITGLDGQIDNLAGNIFPIIDKATFGLTTPISDFLLGPIFQSATDGVQVLVSNILGGSVDFVEDTVANVFTGSVNKLENIGNKMKVSEKNIQLLEDTKKQWTNLQKTMDSKKKAKVQEPEPTELAKRDGEFAVVKGAIQSFHDKMDSMFNIINNHQGHANAAVLTATITGLDGQIDNLAGNIFPIIDKATFGLTTPISDFLLGPIFQSATDGVQVLVSNILGGSVDFVEDTVANVFTGSVNKLENIGNKMKVSEKNIQLLEDTKKQWTNLQKTMDSKKKAKVQEPEPTELAKRDGELAVVKGAIQSFHDKMDSMFNIINNHQGHANAAVLTATITGLDGQIDNLAGNIFPIIDKATFGLTTPISDFLLGPIFQSATDGVQVLVSNILGGSVDFVEDTVANVFTGSVNKLENIGNKMKVSEKNIQLLEDTKKQWTNLQKTMDSKKKAKVQEPEPTELAKRDGELAVVKGAIQSFHDKMDSMFNIINNHQGHANAAVLTAVITGLDGQVDNLAGNIFPIIDKATFGLTTPISDFLLGPIFQSATDGVQVLVSNILGGSVDFVEDTVANVFTGTVNKLENIGNKMKVSEKNIQLLEDTKKQWTNLQNTMDSKKKDSVEKRSAADSIQGAINSYEKAASGLFNEINNAGHATASTLSSVIGSIEKEIESLYSTVVNDLKDLTGGSSLGDVFLAPAFQSTANGVQVLISNVLGGNIQMVDQKDGEKFTESLSKLEEIGKNLKVSGKTSVQLTNAKKQWISLTNSYAGKSN